nr:PREDICTED: zinc finger protein 808-like [Bemisia tabaci]
MNHIMKHSEEIKCEHCDMIFLRLDVLKRHIMTEHQEEIKTGVEKRASEDPAEAVSEDQSETNFEEYAEANSEGHAGTLSEDPVEPIRGRRNRGTAAASWPPEGQLLTCNDCNRTFKARSNLLDHMKVHSGETKCKICHRVFSNVAYMKLHMRLKHGHAARPSGKRKLASGAGQPKAADSTPMATLQAVTCQDCERRFKTLSALINHKKTHAKYAKKPDFVCNVCGHGFETPSDLVNHRRTHSRPAEIKCKMCKKVFSNKNNLRFHVAITHY